MKKFGAVLLFVLICLSAVSAYAESFRSSFSNALERNLQQKPYVAQNPGMGRLLFMRFYHPSDKMPEEAGFFTKLFGWGNAEEQSYCTAVYLFNMYITAAAYKEDVPARLTTDYLGVLDSFGKCRTLYKAEDAENFYNKNKSKIKTALANFFDHYSPSYNPLDPASDRRELAFMRLLKTAPWYRARPGYFFSSRNRLTGTPSASSVSFVADQLRRTLAQNRNKVITFERAYVRGEDLDRKIGIKSSNVERTYRCVNDECEYCSYEMGKLVCRTADASSARSPMRVYKITASPLVPGNPLRPAQGTRFTLASGETAPKWNYHTAILVVMKNSGQYVALVADKFLAGAEPLPLNSWLQAFYPADTMFSILPFERSQEVEAAIKMVESRQGNTVKADGLVYSPAPIEW